MILRDRQIIRRARSWYKRRGGSERVAARLALAAFAPGTAA